MILKVVIKLPVNNQFFKGKKADTKKRSVLC